MTACRQNQTTCQHYEGTKTGRLRHKKGKNTDYTGQSKVILQHVEASTAVTT